MTRGAARLLRVLFRLSSYRHAVITTRPLAALGYWLRALVSCTEKCTCCFLQNPAFKEALEATRAVPGTYIPCGRTALSTTMLDRVEAADSAEAKRLFLAGVDKLGVTIVGDGKKDCAKRPLVNVLAVSAHGVLVLDVVDCSGEVKVRLQLFLPASHSLAVYRLRARLTTVCLCRAVNSCSSSSRAALRRAALRSTSFRCVCFAAARHQCAPIQAGVGHTH